MAATKARLPESRPWVLKRWDPYRRLQGGERGGVGYLPHRVCGPRCCRRRTGRCGLPGESLASLTRSLALELAPRNIRVVALCPAASDTPMLVELVGGVNSSESRSAIAEAIPMGRLARPDEVAGMAAWAASKDARMVTGETDLGGRRPESLTLRLRLGAVTDKDERAYPSRNPRDPSGVSARFRWLRRYNRSDPLDGSRPGSSIEPGRGAYSIN